MQQREKPSAEPKTSDGTMNKGGRPRVAVKKDRIISVKCDPLEKKAIQKKAEMAGYTTSEYLRTLALKTEAAPAEKPIPPIIQELLASFRHTGSNFNQIAKRLNMDDPLTPYLREQLLYHLEELQKLEERIKARLNDR